MGPDLHTTKGSQGETLNGVLYSVTIPVEKHYSQKNNKRLIWRGKNSAAQRPMLISSENTMRLSKHILSAMQIRAKELGLDKPISCPMSIMLTISIDNFWTVKGTINKKAGDLDNLIQGPIDCLMKAGIVEDDAFIVSIMAKKQLGKNQIELVLIQDIDCPETTKQNPRKKGNGAF